MPSRPDSETGRFITTVSRRKPSGRNTRARLATAIPPTEKTANAFALLATLRPVRAAIFGNQGAAPGSDKVACEKSMMVAPASRDGARHCFAKALEPVRKTYFAAWNVSSSTRWMKAASPAASVRVPATSSSSTRRKSQVAKMLSSRRDFTSFPSNHDALGVPPRWHGLNGSRDQPVPKDADDVQDDSYQCVGAGENDKDVFR